MWSPTHIQVTIRSAKGLLTKGKNNTNNCFVTIALGKEKYQTSVKDKVGSSCSWNEECELKIPDQGNRAELILTCLHHNNLGLDEFLGQVTLPLNEMDVYDRPRARWYKLESKANKEKKNKERGELDVMIAFTVKSGSLTDLSKKEKHKSSIGQLASTVGGSLLSIGTLEKRKGIKKFAKSLGSKMHLHGKKKVNDGDDNSYSGSFTSIGTPNRVRSIDSEDEDEFQFDNLSQKSSVGSLHVRDGLQASGNSFGTRNSSSPLHGSGSRVTVGKQSFGDFGSDNISLDQELEQMENDFSIRTRTLPPPSKPPRITPHIEISEVKDEFATKLYGRHLDLNQSNSIKKRSYESDCVPLPVTNEYEADGQEENNKSIPPQEIVSISTITEENSHSSLQQSQNVNGDISEVVTESNVVTNTQKSNDLPLTVKDNHNLLLPSENNRHEFDKFNASFAKFEQQHSDKIFSSDTEAANTQPKRENILNNGSHQHQPQPQPKPKPRLSPNIAHNERKEQRSQSITVPETVKQIEEKSAIERQQQMNEERRREAKRLEEDQRILNFSRRFVTPEERSDRKLDQFIRNTKQFNHKMNYNLSNNSNGIIKRDKSNSTPSTPSPKSGQRIIIGHEKVTEPGERRAEISAALAKKYEGKTREELMLIANGMENEALLQRQRVKELEDYLDNLLLRVMETHPKLLQNPYSRTTSAKSG